MTAVAIAVRQVVSDLPKVGAFIRRDLLITLSYRLALVADWINLLVQMVTFYYVGKIVDGATMPVYGGARASYVEFVSIGIALTTFMAVALTTVVQALRTEQLAGTLEVLLTTPTSVAVIQLGSAVYQAVYIPLRTAVFLGFVALIFGARFDPAGVPLTLLIVALFVPVVWGLGLVSAASTMTFRRGGGLVGLGTIALTVTSGAYFPVDVMPGWLTPLLAYNPIGLTLEGVRRSLLGDGMTGGEVFSLIALLVPMAAVTLALGGLAFRQALRREIRRGTLGVY